LVVPVLEKEGDLKQAEKIIKHRAWGGPFKLVEYQRGNFYRVARNEKYYKKGKPYLDGITHFIVVDTGRLMSSFQAGQLDMMNSGFSNLTPKEYLDLQAQMGVSLSSMSFPAPATGAS
jgi:ABC-type transport system substrate-binding protein